MGWGKKTTGAKPQPNPMGAPDPDVMSKSRMKRLEAMGRAGVIPHTGAGTDPDEVPAEQPTATAKAETEWAQFRAKKGWMPETVATILYEFIKDRGLFADLIAYARKRR